MSESKRPEPFYQPLSKEQQKRLAAHVKKILAYQKEHGLADPNLAEDGASELPADEKSQRLPEST